MILIFNLITARMRKIIIPTEFSHNSLSHSGVLLHIKIKTQSMSIFWIAVISYFVLYSGYIFVLRRKAKLLPDDFDN
jgi:hypothetical protein